MLTEHMAVNLPRSIVTDHYLLDPEGVLIPDSLGPANNLWKLKGVHILPMAFPWTLAIMGKT